MKKIAVAAALMAALGIGQASASSYDDLNAGIQFRNLRQWNDEIGAFDKALAAGDLLPNQQYIAHLDRGQAHQLLKQYDLALADYSSCLALEPNNAAALFQRAIIYLDTGKLTEAAADLDSLVALRPMLAPAYNIRAAIDARLGNAPRSLADSKMALSLLPDDYARRNIGTGIVAWQAGRTEVAEENFSYAITHGNGNVYAWLWLALTRVRMGKDVPKDDLPDFDKKSWPTPIVMFFTGDMTQDEVFAATGEGGDAATQGRVCEANFYIGEWLLQHHDAAAAQPMIQKAASDCPMNFVEWGPAQVELAGISR
ncbi:MAG TPA: tetratricopeptide repeat protein [Rhizomicrobium sp.]|nr:tetratricopeptide repeat protein [Rhizomicrobium sp.]